jgi:hypothetical protein
VLLLAKKDMGYVYPALYPHLPSFHSLLRPYSLDASAIFLQYLLSLLLASDLIPSLPGAVQFGVFLLPLKN